MYFNKNVMPVFLSVFLTSVIPLMLAGCGGGDASTATVRPLASDAVILAFGDSLTRGKGADMSESYPARLQSLSGRTVVNSGINGELASEGSQRLPRVLDEVAPDLLILWHGGNDILRSVSPELTKTHLEDMIAIAQARDIDIVLVRTPSTRVVFNGARDIYQELADAYQLPIESSIYIRVYANRSWMSDSVHPNATGYDRIARAMHEILTEVGAWP